MKRLLCMTALGFAFATAQAAVTLSPTAGGGYAGMFTASENGGIFDTFDFAPATFTGEVSVDLTPASGSIAFFTALLNGQGFAYLPESGATSFVFQAWVTADQPLELQVFGFSGDASTLTPAAGSYTGVVTLSPVPEPAGLALLAAGLGMVLARLRRRRG